MDINYKVGEINQSYKSLENPISSYLANQRGDCLLISSKKKDLSYFGLSLFHHEEGFLKILNQFELFNVESVKTIYEGFRITNIYSSTLCVSDEKITEKYYLGPSGGLTYEILGYQGRIKIDLDIRKFFSNNIAKYSNYIKDNILFIKSELNNEDIFIGFNLKNLSYHIINRFEKKIYLDNIETQIYNFLELDIGTDKKISIGIGFSETEVLEQLELLENHIDELLGFDYNITKEITTHNFIKPVLENTALAYKQSLFTYHQLLKRNLSKKFNNFLLSGFPTRGIKIFDEIFSLKTLINREDFIEVKLKLEYLLTLINNNTGLLPKYENSSKPCLSSIFILAKRFEDLIFALDEKNKLYDFFSPEELEKIYVKLIQSFDLITKLYWSYDESLLFVNNNDLVFTLKDGGFYLEAQAGYLNFISVLGTFSTILHKQEADKYIELESDFKQKIKESFFKDRNLSSKLDSTTCSYQIFLAYYYYPDLLHKDEWKDVFLVVKRKLKTEKGYILCSSDDILNEENVLHSNEFIKHDDILFWIEHLIAIVFSHFSAVKLKEEIKEILLNSSKSISGEDLIGCCSNLKNKDNSQKQSTISLLGTAVFMELVELIQKD